MCVVTRGHRYNSCTTVCDPHRAVQVHLYQGRNLPSADDNGSLDPYIKLIIGSSNVKSRKKLSTTCPQWYDTIVIDTELPPDLVFAPQLLLQLWDWDAASADDFVSDCHLSFLEPGCRIDCTGPTIPVRCLGHCLFIS